MPAHAQEKRILGALLAAVWVASFATGCAAVLPWGGKLKEQNFSAAAESASGEKKKPAPPATSTGEEPPEKKSPAPPPSQKGADRNTQEEKDTSGDSSRDAGQLELEQILDRLQQQGRLLPQQREKLAQDLALVDRSAWPILIQYFLASAQAGQQNVLSPGGAKPPAKMPAESPSSWPRSAGAGENQPASPPQPSAAFPAAKTAVRQLPPPGGQAPGSAASTTDQGRSPVPSSSQSRPLLQPTAAQKTEPQRAEKTSPSAQQALSPQQQLQRLIASLEQQTQGPARSLEELQRHVYLRMLYLLAGRREQALEPIPGIPAPQQQYWTNQLYALAVYLDGEAIAHSARRATEAKVHLDQAAYHLGTAGNLVVKNLAFCTAVRSYGVIGEFEQEEFRPGQVVLLYAELENFSTEETPEGYRTTLRGSYQIYDARGNQVASEELPVVEDVCRNRRRDFFVSYRIQLPQRIYPGRHKLQLTIEDVKSQRMATGTLEFSVAK